MTGNASPTVNVLALAKAGGVWRRKLPLRTLPDYSEWLESLGYSGEGDIDAALSCVLVQEGRIRIGGVIQVQLRGMCQLCLEMTSCPLRVPLELLLQLSGAPGNNDSQAEIIQLDAPQVNLCALVEEELILETPLALVHNSARQCNGDGTTHWRSATNGRVGDRTGPFAGLAACLGRKRSTKERRT